MGYAAARDDIIRSCHEYPAFSYLVFLGFLGILRDSLNIFVIPGIPGDSRILVLELLCRFIPFLECLGIPADPDDSKVLFHHVASHGRLTWRELRENDAVANLMTAWQLGLCQVLPFLGIPRNLSGP